MKYSPPDYSDLEKLYGKIENGIWMESPKHMRVFDVPKFVTYWGNTASKKHTKQIFCNQAIHAPLMQALLNLQDARILDELNTFDGCYNVRMVRGSTTKWSTHSWGMALDVNAFGNELGRVPTVSKQFVDCWKAAGWNWGGDYKRLDGMHYAFVNE